MGIFVWLKDRDGVIQPSTDGYHASGKDQVWTANWQLLPKQRRMRGKRTTSTSSMYIEWMWGKTNEGRRKFYLLHIKLLMTILWNDANYLNQPATTETINPGLFLHRGIFGKGLSQRQSKITSIIMENKYCNSNSLWMCLTAIYQTTDEQ